MIVTTNKYESIQRILLKYEANDDSDNYTLKSGSLKPQSLELSGFTKSSRSKKISDALSKAVENNNISENIKNLCILLSNAVANEKSNSKVDVISNLLAGNPHEFSATIRVNKKDKTLDTIGKNTSTSKLVSLLKNSDIKNEITKDFGEILGPIFLLNHVTDAESVVYSSDKSEQVKDYNLKLSDKSYWSVSAKALKRANAPSISGLIKAINNSGNDTLNELLDGEDSTVGELRWLVSILQDKSTSKDEWIQIVKRYSEYSPDYGESELKTAFEEFNKFFDLKDSSDYDVDKFNDIFDKKCYSNLKEVKNIISYVWTKLGVSAEKSSVNLDQESADYYTSLNPKTKIGIFMYPIIKKAVTVMNKRLGIYRDSEKTDTDIFTKVARYYFSGYKQLYLDVDLSASGSVDFKFKMIEMGECDWTLIYDKSTMNNPYTRLQMKVKAS